MAGEHFKCRGLWWGLVACIVLIAIAIGSWFQLRRNNVERTDEPVYQGKSFSAWLVEASSLPDDNDPSLNAIREIGPPAVPLLLPAFREGTLPSRVQRYGRDVMQWEVQERAAEALKALGPAAAEVVPDIVECLKNGDKKMRAQSAEILGKTSVATKPVCDALLSALNDPDVAFEASRSLAALGRKGANVVYGLTEVAKSGKKSVANYAAFTLAQIGPRAKPALPVLIELITVPSPDSDWEAVKAIGMIGSEAAPAVPALVRVLEAGGPWARKCAAISLGRIGPAAKAAVPTLKALQKTEDSNYTKADIARALWRIDRDQSGATLTAAQSIVEDELRAAATEESISYGLMSALDLLGELGTNAATAMPVVMKAVQFDDPHVQLCAAWAAFQIDAGQRAVTTNVLWRLIGVENFPLEDFGKGPFAGLASLKRDRESYHIRVAAVGMLWQIAPEARGVLKTIVKQSLREWRLWTSMNSIIPEDAAIAPVLEELLKDEQCRDLHPVAEEVLDHVTGTEAERW
jgi:HEAT repeat protein